MEAQLIPHPGNPDENWPDYWHEQMRVQLKKTGSPARAAEVITELSGRPCARQMVMLAARSGVYAKRGGTVRPHWPDKWKARARELRAEMVGKRPMSYERIASIISIEAGRPMARRLAFYWLNPGKAPHRCAKRKPPAAK